MKSAVACAALASVAFAGASAAAFSPKGHVTIEAKAYERLVADEKIDDGAGGTVRGVDVLATLIRGGYLERPRCFEPKSQHEKESCDSARRSTPVRFWPVTGSGSPDMMSSRQFSTNGQCFHFMSSSSVVWETKIDPWLGVPRGMIDDAYMRCTRTLGDLFVRMMRDPVEANRDYRGLYAIIHIVADSYSRAHVERNERGEILYLKPWQLRAFLPYMLPGRWKGYRWLWTDTHHAVSDERDEDYELRDPSCRAELAAYEVEERCLTKEGRAAVAAIEDLLITVYRLERRREREEKTDAKEAIAGFIERRMKSARANVDLQQPFEGEREWSPAYSLGFRYRPRPRPGADHDMMVVAGATLFSDVTLPLVPFISFEAGCRYVRDRCVFTFGGDALSLLLPVTDGLVVGFTPVAVSSDADAGLQHARVAMNVVRGDVYLFDAFWLSLSGPSYSWVQKSFDGEPFSIAIGVAWDGRSTPFAKGGPAEGVGDARFLFDSRHLSPGDGAPIAPWKLPPLDHDFRRARVTNVIHVIGGSLLRDGGAGAYSIGGYEALWDRDREGRRSGLALGARADSEYRPTADDKTFAAVAGPVARWYVVRDRLAIEADPALFDFGVRAPNGEGARGAFDVEGGASLALVPIARAEVAVDAPRLSYAHARRVDGTNLGLRLGFFLQ